MYPPEELTDAEARLRDFLVGRFGGPSRYIERRGHPRLRMRHMPFAVDGSARDRWMLLMGRALDEDGELWRLWYTSVPEPAETQAYIAEALTGYAEGHRL